MSDDDLTHYEVLGVEPGASKDEIREAYRRELGTAQSQVTNAETARKPDSAVIASARAEEASVRAAWQILSDPVQRSRYDDAIGVEGAAEGTADDLDDDDETVEAAATTAVARRSRDQTPREARAEARAKAMENRPPGLFSTDHPATPAGWPPGHHAPPPRARLLALLVDSVVLALIVVLQTTLGGLLIDQAYPKESKQLDHVTDCLDALSTASDDAGAQAAKRDASVEKANSECARFAAVDGKTVFGEPIDSTLAKKQLEKQIDNKNGKVEDYQTDLRNDILPGQLAVSFITIALALLYLVPSSVRSGRTLGKKLLQIRLINIDGSPAGLRGSLLHYGVPVMVALLFAPILGPLGYVAVLFGVLTWPRNANYQGLHDRLAGTIVVDG